MVYWRSVLTGFVVAIVVGIGIAFLVPITSSTVWVLAIPGLVGGFVAGYMVYGAGDGAIHGGLATIFGALVLLVFATVMSVFFVGIVPALAGATVALLALFVQAIPGAIAGAAGGWWRGRREGRATTTATTQ